MTFTQVFGGTTIYPSGVSYRAIPLTVDQVLSWPTETATNANVVAQIMDVTPSITSLSIFMPPANEASVGETALFFNAGGNTFTVKDTSGNTIVSILPGLSYQVYLIGNTTANGTWRSTQYSAGTSSATAGSLVGSGIKAINTTLNQSMSVTTLNSNYAIGDADRSEAFVWSGGAGTLTLPDAFTIGSDWFCHVRNSGNGAISLVPSNGSQTINGAASLAFNPTDSAIIVCDGNGFFTIGFGQSASFAFDYVSISLTGQASPYQLSGANLNRIAYSFGGALSANIVVEIPATFQQYWLSNETTRTDGRTDIPGYSITVKVAGQTGVTIANGVRAICYCNGTDLVDADTSSVSFPLLVAQGGTGAVDSGGALINLGGTSVGRAVFTAADATVARTALSAAKLGVNSDITSLTGLTTPLSVPQGGTGAATLTSNGVVLGGGASNLSATAAGTTGQVLVGNTGAAPSWSTLSGIGVTSFSAGTTGFTPSTATAGAVTLAGTLNAANGGTGQSSYTVGDILYASSSTALSKLADVAVGNALISGGVGTAPSWGKIGLTTHVSGTLPIANGGTNSTTESGARQNILPSYTGNQNKVLAVNAGGTDVEWVTNGSGGTVTAVSFTGGIITVANANSTPALTVAGTSGGVPYFSSASTWATSAALAANALVVGGGAGAAPATVTTGTGVVTALGVNTGTAGAFVVNGGALGTPSSGTVTNLTGTASININGTVGATTASSGAFTTLSASSTVSGTGFSTYLASPPAIGGTAAAAGSFTTLSASSTVSGAGFSTYLDSPPAIGGTAAAAGSFTTLSASSTVSGAGFSTYLASPPAIGGTAAAAGTFTTLSLRSNSVSTILQGSSTAAAATYTLPAAAPGASGYVLSATTGGVMSWVANGAGSMVYPSSGIAVSNGSAWSASYSTSGSGTTVALTTSPTFVTPILGTPSSGTLTNCTFPTLNQNTTGSAATLTTARTLTIGSTGKTFNGSANVSWTLSEIGAAASGENTDITALDQDVTVTATGTIAASTIGYRGIPQNPQSSGYQFDLPDAGKHVYSTNTGAQTITVPTNATTPIPVGTAITVVNNGTTPMSFTTTGTTVYKAGTSAAWATGGTLAVRGMATWLKVETNTWFVSGSGLS
jgi:hypothetical protein